MRFWGPSHPKMAKFTGEGESTTEIELPEDTSNGDCSSTGHFIVWVACKGRMRQCCLFSKFKWARFAVSFVWQLLFEKKSSAWRLETGTFCIWVHWDYPVLLFATFAKVAVLLYLGAIRLRSRLNVLFLAPTDRGPVLLSTHLWIRKGLDFQQQRQNDVLWIGLARKRRQYWRRHRLSRRGPLWLL